MLVDDRPSVVFCYDNHNEKRSYTSQVKSNEVTNNHFNFIFIKVAGMKFSFNPKQDPGCRVVKNAVRINDEPLDKNKVCGNLKFLDTHLLGC